MGGRVWTLTQTEDTLWYYVYTHQSGAGGENSSEDSLRAESVSASHHSEVEAEMLRDYFQLHVKLGDLYKEWGAADSHFKKISDIFTG